MKIHLQDLCLFKPFLDNRESALVTTVSFHRSFYTILRSPNRLSLTPCVPFAVSIWDLLAVVCQQQSSKETGAPWVATGKGHQWVKNVNIQPSSSNSHEETGMKITHFTQHRQGETTEDREGRDRLCIWVSAWTQLLKSWRKNIWQNRENMCICVCVCVCDSARKQEARLIKGVFGRGSSLVGVCLFIHSLSTLYWVKALVMRQGTGTKTCEGGPLPLHSFSLFFSPLPLNLLFPTTPPPSLYGIRPL